MLVFTAIIGAQAQDITMKRFSILLVDDEQRILNFLSTKLRISGYEVLTASNGVEALEQVQAQEPDLVVLNKSCANIPVKLKYIIICNLLTFTF